MAKTVLSASQPCSMDCKETKVLIIKVEGKERDTGTVGSTKDLENEALKEEKLRKQRTLDIYWCLKVKKCHS